MNKIKQYIFSFFTTGNQRSVEAKKNIAGSFVIKGVSIFISLWLVPLTIHYVNPTEYGIWLTMSSMVAWISFFDIGFTNGLRNRFAEAKAKNEFHLAKAYVSTAYFYLGVIFISLWLVLIIVNQFIAWDTLLNISSDSAHEVSSLAIIIFSYFCLQFVFRIINTILIADQKPAIASLSGLLGQVISLIIIFLLTKFTSGSLIFLGLALGVAPTLVIILTNVYFFKTKYRDFSPSFQYVQKKYAKDIMGIGLKFFVLQIAAIIQYQTIIFLIAHYFNPLQVTSYNIAYKYFGVLQMGFMILLTPIWSSTTDAYNSGDFKWIINVVKKYLLILIPIILTGAIMLALAEPIYDLWLGKNVVTIPFNISLLCYIYFSTQMFGGIFVQVLNGIGALQIQFYASFLTSIGYLALSLVLIKVFHFGIESILISSILSNIYGYIIAPIQYYKIFIKKSQLKIWYS